MQKVLRKKQSLATIVETLSIDSRVVGKGLQTSVYVNTSQACQDWPGQCKHGRDTICT